MTRRENAVSARPVHLLLTAALLAGCSAGVEQSANDPVLRAPAAIAATAAPSQTTAARTVAVTFVGGEVTGVSSRVSATLGERLVLQITSDVADEIHVHGYDLRADVPAGGTVEIALTADIPGGFEVELEDLGATLFQLRVA